MTAFTAHFFDEHEHLRRSVRLLSSTEDAAIAEAAAIHHRHALEIWTGDRLVWRFEPRLSAA